MRVSLGLEDLTSIHGKTCHWISRSQMCRTLQDFWPALDSTAAISSDFSGYQPPSATETLAAAHNSFWHSSLLNF